MLNPFDVVSKHKLQGTAEKYAKALLFDVSDAGVNVRCQFTGEDYGRFRSYDMTVPGESLEDKLQADAQLQWTITGDSQEQVQQAQALLVQKVQELGFAEPKTNRVSEKNPTALVSVQWMQENLKSSQLSDTLKDALEKMEQTQGSTHFQDMAQRSASGERGR